jgi:hypothetical protein
MRAASGRLKRFDAGCAIVTRCRPGVRAWQGGEEQRGAACGRRRGARRSRQARVQENDAHGHGASSLLRALVCSVPVTRAFARTLSATALVTSAREAGEPGSR